MYEYVQENCWFFASMIQEVLIGKFEGQYETGSLNQPRLGKQRRASILRRVYFGTQAANELTLMQNLHCHHPDQYRRELARRLEDFDRAQVRDSKTRLPFALYAPFLSRNVKLFAFFYWVQATVASQQS